MRAPEAAFAAAVSSTNPVQNVLVLVINLDRSTDRLAAISASLVAHGLEFERVSAIDGSVSADLLNNFDHTKYWRAHGREVRAAEIGCYYSHLRAMRRFLETTYEYALILEDDAVLLNGFNDVVAAATGSEMSSVAAPQQDWDVLKLESRRRGLAFHLRPLTGRHDLVVNAFRSTGAAAYIVTREAARTYLGCLYSMRQPYDHAFDRGWWLGLRIRELRPLVVTAVPAVSPFPSTIEVEGSRPRKIKGLAKLPALAFRTRTEAMRALDAIATVAVARLRHAFAKQG